MGTKAKVGKRGRAYIFGSYRTKAEALRAAKGLRRDRSLFAYTKKNPKTKMWDVMYGSADRAKTRRIMKG